MEVVRRFQVLNLKEYFLKEARPFTSKRDIHWMKVKVTITILIIFIIAAILAWPSSNSEVVNFYEKGTVNNSSSFNTSTDPIEGSARQLQDARGTTYQVHSSLDYLYKKDDPVSTSRSPTNRNSGMILARNGFDSRSQLSPGTRVYIRLTESVTVEGQAMPVIGIVSKDVNSESGAAINAGSKVLGEIAFDPSNERTSVIWRSIILSDGRERSFSALGMGKDGQVGLDARVRSVGAKNAVGKTLTKFVGAYAAGSINTGAFGANPGGSRNGLRNAIAETSSERANAIGEDLQKERKWVELESGTEITSVINQPFSFRDPGGINGQ